MYDEDEEIGKEEISKFGFFHFEKLKAVCSHSNEIELRIEVCLNESRLVSLDQTLGWSSFDQDCPKLKNEGFSKERVSFRVWSEIGFVRGIWKSLNRVLIHYERVVIKELKAVNCIIKRGFVCLELEELGSNSIRHKLF